VAEGARLESVFTVTGNEGSNPSLSATLLEGGASKRENLKKLKMQTVANSKLVTLSETKGLVAPPNASALDQ